jgi:hypothetical protein
MPKGRGIELDGKRYNIVQDHETYVVSDVPAHPDSDSRMERRVHYDSFLKGYLKRRASANPLDSSIYSMNIYNRIEKAGEGLWFSWGGDTRMGDRIFGQRLTNASQVPASPAVLFGDGSIYSYIACQQHVYSISGISAGTQQIVLSKDFTGISPAVQIVDAASFNGRIYIATVQLTNGVPDYSKPQPIWVWDQSAPTASWTNPPTPLAAVTWPASVTTSLSAPVAASGATTISVGTTTGIPNGSTIVIDSEMFTTNTTDGVTLTILTRGAVSSPVTAHQTGATVTYNPATAVSGAAGQVRWQYWIITSLAGQDSIPSSTQTFLTGNATLSVTNYNTITFNTVTGQSYTVFRAYAGGAPNSVGIIGTGISGTGSPITFNDTGLPVTSLHYQITPQFAIGDIGNASAFAVIRNVLWRAAGSKMWAWDGQQATWSGETVIGDPHTNITGLDIYQDGLIVFKQDGIFTLNRTGDVFPLFPGFRTLGLNPRALGQWQGSYYFASDVGMVWQWDGTTVTSIGFDFAEAYPFPDGTFGLPNAATRAIQLPNYMLVGFNKYNSNNNAAFFLAWDGMGWHPFHYDSTYKVSGLGLTGGNQVPPSPTIQFGKVTWNNTANAINYLTQPTLDPYLITSYDTVPQTIFLPVDSGIISDEWKVLEGIRIFVENPTVGIVRIAYCTDDNIFNQQFVDFGAPQNDRTTIQTFQPSGTLPIYRKIMFRVTMTPDANNATPIVRMIMHRYKQRESQRKSWKMQLLIEEGQMNPNRTTEHRKAQQMLADLNKARKNQNLVTFKDLVGDIYQVYVESVGESLKTYRSGNFDTTFTAEVILVEPAEVANE